MTEAEGERFRCALEQYRRQAIELLKRSGDEVFDSDSPGDTADISNLCSSKEAWFQRTSGVRHLLRLVEDALERVREHKYGTCINCGDDISPRRLIAVPWAEHCFRCQEALEGGSSGNRNSHTRPHTLWRYTA
jgi:DnaK suppressor protein